MQRTARVPRTTSGWPIDRLKTYCETVKPGDVLDNNLFRLRATRTCKGEILLNRGLEASKQPEDSKNRIGSGTEEQKRR
jgi:hypothetical protein